MFLGQRPDLPVDLPSGPPVMEDRRRQTWRLVLESLSVGHRFKLETLSKGVRLMAKEIFREHQYQAYLDCEQALASASSDQAIMPTYRVVYWWYGPGWGWGPGPDGWQDWQVEDFADRRSANDWAAAFLRSNRNHGFTGGGAEPRIKHQATKN